VRLLRSESEFSGEPFITKANCVRATGHSVFASIIAGVRKESAVTGLSTQDLEDMSARDGPLTPAILGPL
jgi:hypothetical protein